MNILYIDSGGMISDSHQYQYYGDLYRELRELATVLVYQGPVPNIYDLLSRIDGTVDCIIFGLGYFAQGNPGVYGKIVGLDNINIPVVCMLHKPQSLLSEKLHFCKINKADLLLDSQSTYKSMARSPKQNQSDLGLQPVHRSFTHETFRKLTI